MSVRQTMIEPGICTWRIDEHTQLYLMCLLLSLERERESVRKEEINIDMRETF